jgi:hypothetical protein
VDSKKYFAHSVLARATKFGQCLATFHPTEAAISLSHGNGRRGNLNANQQVQKKKKKKEREKKK